MAIRASVVVATVALAACGGGGGGAGDSGDLIRYPYETVYGDVCRNSSEPTPGCTFVRATGQRVIVTADPSYNRTGHGSDDMWYVVFDSNGVGHVYDQYSNPQYTASPSDFAGHIGGSTIGVGVTGAFWEDVRGGTYWFGTNGVLYSANSGETNYGQAINNKEASKSGDLDSFALKSESNVKLIKAGAEKLSKEYGLPASKAVAVASALNSIMVMQAERGKVTAADVDSTMRTVFGVSTHDALAAFKGYMDGDMSQARELSNRTAETLDISQEQAKDLIKGMYSNALSNWGYDVNEINW